MEGWEGEMRGQGGLSKNKVCLLKGLIENL